MVSLVGVIRLVHILFPVPSTHRVARVRYIHALRRLTTIVDSGLAWTVTWWGTGGVQVASLNLRPLHLPFSSKSRAGLRFREGEEHPVPHGQCFMPVRVPSGIGGWFIIVLLAFPTSVYSSMRCHPVMMPSSLGGSRSGRFLASSSGACNLWVEDMRIG